MLALLVIGLVALSCSDDGRPTAPRGGVLSILLTDAPIDALAEINVFLVELKIKPVDGPVERIASNVGPIELLALRDSTELIAAAAVEPGSYEFVEILLDEDQSNVVELETGAILPLKIASEKFQVRGGFVVDQSTETVVTLDFDAEQSLHQRGNGDWIMTPVVLQVGVEQR